MYTEHPIFTQPDDLHVKVWRYMDFTKLVSLVDSRRLFFPRADKLGDPFEGSWPRINVNARQQIPDEIPPAARENFLRHMADMGNFYRKWQKYNAVSCWHMNEHESAAMWKLYLKSDEGIAVQSTYSRLRDSLVDEEQIFMGTVRYIDYEREWIDSGNLLSPFVHKRKSFEHEREVRAVVLKFPVDQPLDLDRETITDSLKIRIDLERLVEKIYIAPSAPVWFADLVRALLNRYNYGFEVAQSKLNEQPVF